MSRLDTRFGRGDSFVGSLDRLPAPPALAGREAGLEQNDRLSPAFPAAIGQAELRRVVLVESDQYYREVLTFELLCQGFVVHAFADGAALLGSLASAVDADLAVLDWDLAKMPGIKLLAELRRHGVNLPVVFLTGKVIAGDEHDRCLLAPPETLNANECMAFDHGAVDFIAKSRGRQVLVRRLRNVVELAKPKATTDLPVQKSLTCDKLVLKPETGRAFWKGVDVGLTLGEYKLIHLLVSNAGSFVTYRAAYDRLRFEGFIAGSGNDGFRANVRSVIKRIRNRFRACDPAFDKIENYTGFGYCWRKPD
jgi:two-component system, OmpR family, response regulator ChvI